jgi:hypothetical protein
VNFHRQWPTDNRSDLSKQFLSKHGGIVFRKRVPTSQQERTGTVRFSGNNTVREKPVVAGEEGNIART